MSETQKTEVLELSDTESEGSPGISSESTGSTPGAPENPEGARGQLRDAAAAGGESFRIIQIDTDTELVSACRRELEQAGMSATVDQVSTPEEFSVKLWAHPYDVVLCEYQLPTWSGLEALDILRKLRKDIPLILVTAGITVREAADSMRRGAADYVVKGELARLPIAIRRVLTDSALRAESSRQRSERDRFFMLSLDLLCIVNFDGSFRQANPAWQRTLGFGIEELVAEPILSLIHPEDRERAEAEIQTLIKGSTRSEFELRCRCKDGSYKWLQWRATSIPSQKEIYTSARDITERKQAEANLREREERITEQAALLDKAQDAILVQTLEGKIVYWNKSAERTYGWTAEEVVGKRTVEFLQAAGPASKREVQGIVLEKGEWTGEINHVRKDCKKVIVESHQTLVRDGEGRPKSILVINTDITAKKSLEVQFLRTQRLESIGNLASGIAHDLNNVLTPIMMSVELLRANVQDERGHRLLDTLLGSAQHGAEMVKQILSFTRGMSGEKAPLQLKHLVLEMQQIAKDTFSRSIQIQTKVSPGLWSVAGDRTQMHQVLMNLCVNARDAMPTGGVLRIEAENVNIDEHYAQFHLEAKVGAYVVLVVNDTGCGMAPEILDKIFEPFFTQKPVGMGTGLGLSTVVGIAKNHGGFVNVYSEVGLGSRFRVYIPALPTSVRANSAGPQAHMPAGHGEQVLVVDDEPSYREITRSILEKFNYRVLTASEGTEAVSLYQKNPGKIDAVITDMMMPILDGPATIRALQKLDPAVRLIATSGLATYESMPASEGHSEVLFLLKPYRTEKLLQTLDEVIHGASKSRPYSDTDTNTIKRP